MGAPQYVRQKLTSMKAGALGPCFPPPSASQLLAFSPGKEQAAGVLVSICLTYCGAPMLGAYIFIIVIPSSWIDPLVIM